ncbi:MAG: hypothetical protein D3906_07280 [Candidatus Electrothrix sp. AUS1_2]|nr:hypothetical protein [Candidatus Electrothrix sp. AUS1_2]
MQTVRTGVHVIIIANGRIAITDAQIQAIRAGVWNIAPPLPLLPLSRPALVYAQTVRTGVHVIIIANSRIAITDAQIQAIRAGVWSIVLYNHLLTLVRIALVYVQTVTIGIRV